MSFYKGIIVCLCLVCLTANANEKIKCYPVEKYPLCVVSGLAEVKLCLKIEPFVTSEPDKLQARVFNSEQVCVSTMMCSTDKKDRKICFTWTPADYGYYRISVVDEKTEELFNTSYAVLRPLPSRFTSGNLENFRFGVNTHFDHKLGDLDVLPELLSEAGFRWVRDTLYWNKVEKIKGQYKVLEYNLAALNNLKSRGISALICLCYNNQHYPHATEQEAGAYGKYAEFCARSLKGYGDAFEIWNEPNGFAKLKPDEYPRILKAGFEGVKRGNPHAMVIGMGGPSAGGWGGHYIPTVLKVGGQAWMDSFSIHPYCSPHTAEVGYRASGGPAPRSSIDYLHRITSGLAEKIRVARKMDKRPAAWITEIGWPTTQISLEAQAQQVARCFIFNSARADDIERTFLYDMLCDGAGSQEMEHNFGLVEHDYQPRMSYVAAATAARAVDGLPFIRRVKHDYDGVHLYLFGDGNKSVLAAWVAEVSGKELESGKMLDGTPSEKYKKAGSRPDLKMSVNLKGVGENTELRDWQDRTLVFKLINGKTPLTLTPWPQYLYLDQDSQRIMLVK